MANEVILVDGMFCDEHKFNDGGSITKLSFNVQKFVGFLNLHANEKGWVNVDVARSKTSQKLYGKLNLWKPNSQQSQQSPQGGYNGQQQGQYSQNTQYANQATPTDGLPALPNEPARQQAPQNGYNPNATIDDDGQTIPF